MKKYKINLSFRYSVDVKYSSNRDCYAAGCDGICRCGTIDDARVESTKNIGHEDVMVFDYSSGRPENVELSEIDKYCVDRILRLSGAYNVDSWEVIISGGYYGEEIDDIKPHPRVESFILAEVERMLNMSEDIDKVKYVLSLEYCNSPPKISLTTELEIVDREISHLLALQTQLIRASDELDDREIEEDLPQGIVVGPRGDVLVDGFHRLSKLKKGGHSWAKFIWLK